MFCGHVLPRGYKAAPWKALRNLAKDHQKAPQAAQMEIERVYNIRGLGEKQQAKATRFLALQSTDSLCDMLSLRRSYLGLRHRPIALPCRR